jgi:hypothetical protein
MGTQTLPFSLIKRALWSFVVCTCFCMHFPVTPLLSFFIYFLQTLSDQYLALLGPKYELHGKTMPEFKKYVEAEVGFNEKVFTPSQNFVRYGTFVYSFIYIFFSTTTTKQNKKTKTKTKNTMLIIVEEMCLHPLATHLLRQQ